MLEGEVIEAPGREETAAVAASQKVLIAATAIGLADAFFFDLTWLAIAAFPVVVWAGLMIGRRVAPGWLWLWLIGLLIPIFTPVTAIVLSDRATDYLRQHGIRVGLLGALDGNHKLQSGLTMAVVLAAATSFVFAPERVKTLSWVEEVQLTDGKIITVSRTADYTKAGWTKPATDGVFDRASVRLDGPASKWEGAALPMVIDRHDGSFYLLAVIASFSGVREFGKPYPGYVAFRLSEAGWTRIDLARFPPSVPANLLVVPDQNLVKAALVSIDAKQRTNSRTGLPEPFRKLMPDYRLPY